jgi:REP element-mobilizing transposase RayT
VAYPLRMFIPGLGYFVTARCVQARYLLRPSSETNEVLGGVLARAARMFEVEVFAFAFQSNHLHLLVRAPRGNLPRFMQFVQANISKKVGALTRWSGTFWERRYSAEPVLDEESLVALLRYILSQGVKDGLVRKVRDWPGLNCLRMLVRGSRKNFPWFSWSKRWLARKQQAAKDRFDPRWSERETLQLVALPHWAHLSQKQRARRVLELVRSVEEEAEASHERVLGPEAILAQHPHQRPAKPERSPRPHCHAAHASTRRAYIEVYRAYVATFRSASVRWRLGELETEFPLGAFRPFLWPPSYPALALAA